MTPIPFPQATRELRIAWADDLAAALGKAETILQANFIPLDQRIALQVDIHEVRAALTVERGLLEGKAQ